MRSFAWAVAAVALVAVCAHAASLADGFVFDDTRAIVENPSVQEPISTAVITRDFWGGHGSVATWRPLVTLDFRGDRVLGRGRPWIFHAANLFWHAAAAALLTLALAAASGRRRWALLAGLAFAVGAAQTEAVASLVGRADVMAAAFAFAAWWLWRRSVAAAALAYACALLCKESAIVAPLWMAAGEWLLVAPEKRRRPWAWLALAAVALAYLGARTAVLGATLGAATSANNNPLVGVSVGTRLWTACELTMLALRLTLLPLNSAADYSAAELMPAHGFSLDAVAGALALALLLAAPWALRRRAPALATAAVLFVVPWIMVSNALVALPTIFAERLLYQPAAGAALAYAALIDRGLTVRRGLTMALAALLALGQLLLCVRGDRMWRSDLALFAATVEVSPRSARAWINYGAALQADGQLPEALAAYARSLEVYPTWKGESSLGVVLDLMGQGRAAEPHLRRAVAAAPAEPDAVHNLALFLARHGGRAEAAALLAPMVAAHPERTTDAQLLRQLQASLRR